METSPVYSPVLLRKQQSVRLGRVRGKTMFLKHSACLLSPVNQFSAYIYRESSIKVLVVMNADNHHSHHNHAKKHR